MTYVILCFDTIKNKKSHPNCCMTATVFAYNSFIRKLKKKHLLHVFCYFLTKQHVNLFTTTAFIIEDNANSQCSGRNLNIYSVY